MKFEWDKNKAESNRKKHGVEFSEASTVFADPLEITINDPLHSISEYRFLSIGKSKQGQLLVVSYTEHQANNIRIISARLATKHEKKHYEHNN
ncbi:MAG: BrnT family toxin [Methylococcaceae bacterium]|nr:BrnT family toxin [Methylococcaceae bacterium]